jgi:hypothetical protein
MIICSYGCGKEANYQFSNGKDCCSKNVACCSAIKKKTTGDKNPAKRPEVREILSKKLTGKKRGSQSKEHRKRISNGGRGKKRTKETKKRISESKLADKNPMFGKSPAWKGKTNIEFYGEEKANEIGEKISKSVFELWKNKDSVYHTEKYWRTRAKSESIKPNNLEIIILDFLSKIDTNGWEYTGDFSFWINGRNPDFTNKRKRKLLNFLVIIIMVNPIEK